MARIGTWGGARPPVGLAVVLSCLVAGACGSDVRADRVLRVNGSTTVNPVVAEAAEWLRAERGMTILVDTQGGSSGGLSLLAEGRADVGMSSKPVSARDRERYPDVDFTATRIGVDAVALVVSRDVWEGGVRALTRDDVRGVYEGRIKRWSELGGPDRRIAFFDKEPGRGTWEVFVTWLYGSQDDVPSVSLPRVGGNEEARNKIGSTPGAVGPLSASWSDGEHTFALALIEDGLAVRPTPEAVASGRYPMSRPLYLVTDGAPSGAARTLVDFVLSPRGQALVHEHGYLRIADLVGAQSSGVQ